PTYYGIRVFSEGVGYVFDVSSSMLSVIKVDPGWLKKHRRGYPPEASKFDLARNEIAANLKTLDPRVRFNLYFFRTSAFAWKSNLAPASPSNVGAAVSRMANEKPKPPPRPRPGEPPRPRGNRNQTNYVDVFRLVLDIKRGKGMTGPGHFGDTPDTIYFLTDGRPTTGDIIDPDVLVEWFIELNRFARVKVHVITFGRLGVDPEFLRRLAEENGGVFVQVPEVKR
ncbi:MAG: vWA domain-containing protein, partial [Planctomycetota bacterium]